MKIDIKDMIKEAFDGPDIELTYPVDEGFIFEQHHKNLQDLDLDEIANEIEADENY